MAFSYTCVKAVTSGYTEPIFTVSLKGWDFLVFSPCK